MVLLTIVFHIGVTCSAKDLVYVACGIPGFALLTHLTSRKRK